MNRKRTRIGLILVLLVVASSVSFVAATTPHSSADTASDGWGTHRADSGRTGATNESGPAPYITENWSDSILASTDSNPVVVNGTAYLSTTMNEELPAEGQVFAYDAYTGEQRWESPVIGAERGSPAVANGTVYVATYGTDLDEYHDYGGLYALDAQTGEVKWRANGTEHGSPIVANGTVYGENTAYDAGTGEKLWSASDGSRIFGVVNETAYADNDTSVTARDASDGTVKWTASNPVSSYGMSAVTSNRIYLTAENDGNSQPIYALSTEDGSVVWNRSLPEDHSNSVSPITAPAVADGTVYVTTRNKENGTVYAFDAATGEKQWTHYSQANALTAPTVADNGVYVTGWATAKKTDPGDITRWVVAVYALNKSDGTERASYGGYLGAGYNPNPAVVTNGKIYLSIPHGSFSSRSDLYAFNSSDQKPSVGHQIADDQQKPSSVTIEMSPKDAENRTLQQNQTVVLRANASMPNDDDHIVSYKWDLNGDGTYETTGQKAKVQTGTGPCGQMTVSVKVVDDNDHTGYDSITLSWN